MKKSWLLFITGISLTAVQASSQTWKNYIDSAKTFIGQKNIEKAIEFYIKAKQEVPADSINTATYARLCNDLAIIYRNKGEYKDAEINFKRAKDLRARILGIDHPDYGVTCTGLAMLYQRMEKFKDAIPLFLAGRTIRANTFGTNEVEYARITFYLGICKASLSEMEEAEAFYMEAMEIREKLLGKEHPDFAASCNSLAILYASNSHLDKATPLFEEAKRIIGSSAGKNHPEYLAICTNLAVLYTMKGQYKRAEELSLELLNTKATILGRKHMDYLTSCMNIAVLYRQMGDLNKAESFLLEAKDIIEQTLGKDHPKYAFSCNSLSVIGSDLGQYEKAVEWGLEAQRLRERLLGKQTIEYAQTCSNLSAIYKELGQYGKAEETGLEAKEIFQIRTGKQGDYAEACNNLASVYLEIKNYEKAGNLLTEARDVLSTNESGRAKYGLACVNLGQFHKRSGNYQKAREFFEEGLNIQLKELGENHYLVGIAYANLAEISHHMKEYAYAMDFYRKAFRIQNMNLQKNFLFTSEKEKEFFSSQMELLQQSYLSFFRNYPVNTAFTYDWIISGRDQILNSVKRLHESIYDSATSSLYSEWKETKEQLAYWYSKPINERMDYVSNLETLAQTLEKDLVRKRAGSQGAISSTWKSIQEELQQDEAAIEFKEFQYHNGREWTDSIYYVALILTKNSAEPVYVNLFEQAQIDSLLMFRASSAGKQKINYLYANQKENRSNPLYELIWLPLDKYLSGIRKVYYTPAGSLYKVSFAAIPISGTKLLSDKYELIHVNTTAALKNTGNDHITRSDHLYFYGAIKYDRDSSTFVPVAAKYTGNDVAVRSVVERVMLGEQGGFDFLSGTAKEVQVISSEASRLGFPLNLNLGSEATEESFKALGERPQVNVLHIATHGFFFPNQKNKMKDETMGGISVFRQSVNPLIRSGLAFSGANYLWKDKSSRSGEDGILTSYEVSNMYLPNTRLAVLSACETGLGDVHASEGVYGLQRAFKMAGVENLLMSLWKVPDLETTEFMLEFYNNLFLDKSIREAFSGAQAKMKNKYRADPYKWAAWVLVR